MNNERSAYPKDRHGQLMALLSDHHSGLMTAQFRNSTLLLVALGWLASSKEMQALLRGNIIIPVASTIAVLVLAFIYVAWVRRIYVQCSRIVTELKALDFMPVSHFESRILTPSVAASYYFTQVVLYILIIVFTWVVYCSKPGEETPNNALQRTGAAVTPTAQTTPPPSPTTSSPPSSGSGRGAGR